MSIELKMLMFFGMASLFAWPLLFAGLGTWRDVRRRSETEHTRATGVIVDYAHGSFSSGSTGMKNYWKPIVEFTAEGQAYRLEYQNSMNPNKYPAGTQVDILYDVSDPTRFHLEADPVFVSPGAGAIKVAVIWIIASAALTVALAVFVGGYRFGA